MRAARKIVFQEGKQFLNLRDIAEVEAVITAGKQNVKWGAARVFSSIDRLAPPLDPQNPSDSDRGITDIRTVNEEGTEEPVLTADFARFFDRFGIYGEVQFVRKNEWKPSTTGGLRIDIPAWLNGTVTVLGEYRWDSENDYTKHMLYAGLSGIPVTRKITAGLGFLGALEKLKGVASADLGWKINQAMNARLGYEYLAVEEAGDADFIPFFTGYRHRVSAGITAFY